MRALPALFVLALLWALISAPAGAGNEGVVEGRVINGSQAAATSLQGLLASARVILAIVIAGTVVACARFRWRRAPARPSGE